MRHKKTEICQTCAKIKNACQTCVLDLEYGLPIQVRDSVLGVQDLIPSTAINREFFINKVGLELGPTDTLIGNTKAGSVAKETLRAMARVEPYYARNRPHICSFFVKGECKRGNECPYRHEIPEENDLAHQNIKDRYYGKNDPVANKILSNVSKNSRLPPADVTITSLYVTGIEEDISKDDLNEKFLQFGEIKSIVLAPKTKCAFINYAYRDSAEAAIKSLFTLTVKDHVLKVLWGRSRNSDRNLNVGEKDVKTGIAAIPDIPAPPGSASIMYASTDPNILGTSLKTYRAE